MVIVVGIAVGSIAVGNSNYGRRQRLDYGHDFVVRILILINLNIFDSFKHCWFQFVAHSLYFPPNSYMGILVVLRAWFFLTGGLLPFLLLCPVVVPTVVASASS